MSLDIRHSSFSSPFFSSSYLFTHKSLCDPLSFGLLVAAETRVEEMLIDTKMQMRRFIVLWLWGFVCEDLILLTQRS